MTYNIHDIRAFRRQVGGNIRRCRTARRMTLVRLGKHSNVSPLRLDHYELGKNQLGVDALYCIARALGVAVEELLA